MDQVGTETLTSTGLRQLNPTNKLVHSEADASPV